MLSRASILCRRRPAVVASSRPTPIAAASAAFDHLTGSRRNSFGHFTTATHNNKNNNNNNDACGPRTSFHMRQQTRSFAGRHDRASTSLRTRPPTPKQRKKYHRRRRAAEYEVAKHNPPNSKSGPRRAEERENRDRLVEIAREEEELKGRLGAYFDKVNELQGRIERSPKFTALLEEGKLPPEEIKNAAREAAKKAAEASGTPHPPLPSWIRDRMTYDWGDALVDDLMGNSADLTSSPSPFPEYVGGEYGRLRRKVERALRVSRGEEERLLLSSGGKKEAEESSRTIQLEDVPLVSVVKDLVASEGGDDATKEKPKTTNALSDQLLSDLLRSHRDANGKRTTPIGLGASLRLLEELKIPLSALGTNCYVSLLTCCGSPWEGRKVDEMRKAAKVRSNEYFWSALVDVHARSGDYRGAEAVLDEMLDESRAEHDEWNKNHRDDDDGDRNNPGERAPPPIAVPPLPAYTSFFSSCHKLISRSDVHPSVKSDASNRAWARWKEMRVHSVAPDVMAYGSLMRVFAAQGRAERAIDLLDEIMMQMMTPVNAEGVMGKNGDEVIRNLSGEEDGWYDDRDGRTVRVKPTTLLFTSALRAVAKSHDIANKFNGGQSKKNKRRESVASYHGRLTRKIVVLAEQAEVRQDDGFCSALMMCAAAAGDSSTARAIYLASRVRRMDHLRTCGSKEHLERLQGLIPQEDKRDLLGGGGERKTTNTMTPALSEGLPEGVGGISFHKPKLQSIEEEYVESHAAYEHREYGTDTRPLSALLLAHSKAMESRGLGGMWNGRYNRGYLCPNSLRYMEAHNIPKKENMAIPGLSGVEAGLSPEGWEREDFTAQEDRGKSGKALRKAHKFRMKQIMGDGEGIHRKDDMGSFFDGFDDSTEERVEDERRQILSGGEGDPQNERFALPAGEEGGGGGGVGDEGAVEGSRDWLNDRLFGEDERREMERLSPGSEDGITKMEYWPKEEAPATAANGDRTDGEHFGNDFDSDSDDDDESDDFRELSEDGFDDAPPTESDRDELVRAMAEVTNDPKLAEELIPRDLDFGGMSGMPGEGGDADGSEGDADEDFEFDEDELAKFMEDTERGMDVVGPGGSGGAASEIASLPGVASNDYAAFRTHLEDELVAEGRSAGDVDDREARQLFEMMRGYFEEGSAGGIPGANLLEDDSVVTEESKIAEESFDRAWAEDDGGEESSGFDSSPASNREGSRSQGAIVAERSYGVAFDPTPPFTASSEDGGPTPQRQRSPVGADAAFSNDRTTIYADDYIEWANSQAQTTASSTTVAVPPSVGGEATPSETVGRDVAREETPSAPLPRRYNVSPLDRGGEDPHILELQRALPGLPASRIEKVSEEFERSLGYPSILRLALAVREVMPEAFSPQCLTRVNLANAKHVMAEAEQEGIVDAHLLNGMLRVHTNSGRIEPALRFYDTEYKKHGMTPTTHSDRLLLEMLVKKKRIGRAFKLKQDVERDGRNLDLLSYGSLVEHFGNRKQLGSALLLIKECISVHGSPPGERSLKNVRLVCRQNDLIERVGLEKMVGADPLEWMRKGEQLKRVQNNRSKSSAMLYGKNRMLDI